MHFLENFYNKTVKYELFNKFNFNKTKNLPELKKIILNFGCKTAEMRQLSSSLLALEIISNQKGTMTKTKQSNILLKIRKGNPTGCKVTLTKFLKFNFFSKILIEIFPKLRNFYGCNLSKKLKKKSFFFNLKETFSFAELENHYYLFNNLPVLNIILITNSQSTKELIFLLKSFQIPIKKS